MIEKVIVTFTKPWRGYSPGEVAGFVADTASALIGGGVATAYAGEPAVVSVPLQSGRKGTGKGTVKKAEPTKPTSVPEAAEQDESNGISAESESDGDGAGAGGEGDVGGAGDGSPPADPDDEKP